MRAPIPAAVISRIRSLSGRDRFDESNSALTSHGLVAAPTKLVYTVALRILSFGCSLALVGGLAHVLSPRSFVLCQVAFAIIGVALALGDAGLGLWAARHIASDDSPLPESIFGSRMTLTFLATAALGGAFAIVSTPLVLPYLGALCAYALAIVVRTHLYAQIRAQRGIMTELLITPLTNIVESSVALAILLVWRSVIPALLIMGLLAIGHSSLLLLIRTDRPLSLSLGLPQFGLVRASLISAATPLVYSVQIKALIIALGVAASFVTTSPETLEWSATSLRIADATFSIATLFFVLPYHVSVARTRAVRGGRRELLLAVAMIFTAMAFGPALILRQAPPRSAVFILLAVTILLCAWLLMNLTGHIGHAFQKRQPMSPVFLQLALGITVTATILLGYATLTLIALVLASYTAVAYWRSGLRAWRIPPTMGVPHGH